MPTPVKWSAADFELINSESPEGEPWLSASPDGRFLLTFFEFFPTASPAYTDIETRLYSAVGLDTGLGPAPTFSATTIDHQAASAWFPDGRTVYVWTEEPAAGGGNLEDVYASIYVGNNSVIVPRFLVAGGAGRQLDPVVAASSTGFVIALVDDTVAGGQLVLKFYNSAGGLITTETGADGPETVALSSSDLYRDVEITALVNGNYVITWSNTNNQDVFARIYSGTGVAQSAVIDVETGVPGAAFADVTALADGRFVVSYEEYAAGLVLGRFYAANGTAEGAAFTIGTGAANATDQQVQTAALQDGRFVTVWKSAAGEIVGQVMFADGTADGAAFTVNTVTAGDQSRPTIATLADGRFAVSWESGVGAAKTIITTIFDPREMGITLSGTAVADDFIGSAFGDTILSGGGNDNIVGAAGDDFVYGEGGNDTLFGAAGSDRLYGGAGGDNLDGGTGNDVLHGGLGGDVIRGGADVDNASYQTAAAGINVALDGSLVQTGEAAGDTFVAIENLLGSNFVDTLAGNASNNTILGLNGADTIDGLVGNDFLRGGAGNDVLRGGAGGDKLHGDADIDAASYSTAAAGINVALDGSLVRTGEAVGDTFLDIENLLGSNFIDTLFGNAGANTILGFNGVDTIDGKAGVDHLRGGIGADFLTGGTGADRYQYMDANEFGDHITLFEAIDFIQVKGTAFGVTAGTLAAQFIVRADNNAQDANDRLIFRTTDKTLWYDSNGNAAAGTKVMLADLDNAYNLVLADLQVI